MADCGIQQIDDLVAGKDGAVPLTSANAQPPSLAVIRDLLLCNGGNVPSLRQEQYPNFHSLTPALQHFQKTQGIPFDPKNVSADVVTLQRLTASRPSAKRAYGLASVSLLLDISPF